MIESVQTELEQHLDTLEIGSSRSWEDIEKQYRLLIQRWHPDRNSGENLDLAQTKFIEINTAYKAVREQYRKSGSIPRRLPPEQKGPLLGTKKEVIVKPALYKNKLLVTAVLGIALLGVFGAVLWSLDARLAENNRDRAKVEKVSSDLEAAAAAKKELERSNTIIEQSSNETDQ